MTDITLKVCSRNILQVKIKWFRPSGFKLAICFSYYSYEESLVKIFSLSLAHFLITGGRHTLWQLHKLNLNNCPWFILADWVYKSPQILGLDICADIIVGDEMQRGISGGQKKRVTTGMSASCHFNMKERFAISPWNSKNYSLYVLP